MRLRCFIAIASGRDDTDRFYRNLVAPTLREQRITPVVVERQEHNDDIDDRIISELETCDFAIADLTYARPSVYFEAGFAQPRVPVIYTCRSDHFSARADDPEGNLRIHFHLQMKNIIRWSSPYDKTFAQKLVKRTITVTRPLLRAREKQEMERDEVDAFTELPLQEKIRRVRDASIHRLRRARYRDTHLYYETLKHRYPRNPLHEDLLSSHVWLGTKLKDRTIRAVAVHVTESLAKRKLEHLYSGILGSPAYDIGSALRAGRIQQMVEYIFLCSLQRVPITRVMSSLRHFSYNDERKLLIWDDRQMVPTGPIRGYKEVYMRGRGDDAQCIVYNPGTVNSQDEVTELEISGSRILRYDLGLTKKHGRLSDIPRHLRIRLFDGIRSAESFKNLFSKAVHDSEVDAV